VTPFHLLPEVLSDVDFAPAKAVEPSKRWRNWWYTDCALSFAGGIDVPAGCHQSGRVHPSCDVAKTFAALWLERWGRAAAERGANIKYLGAFPEGEQP